jgi:monofunctional biosynthetic peptidoglycan transglycosylase
MPPPRRRPARASASAPWLRTAGRVLAGLAAAGVLAVGYLAVTVPDVRPLLDAPPIETAFMRVRQRQAHAEGRPLRQDYRFVPYARIAQTLKRAVLVTEDSGFWEHEGIELEAMKESLEASLAKGTIVRGGSTITQQLAKNLYLSESRDPLRKLRELMIAHRLERVLSKTRILELYLNVVEWGDDTWGAEAASRHYFRKSAASLGASEAALLAGALINPTVYNPGPPPRRLLRRQAMILRRMQMRDAPVPPPAQPTATAGEPSATTSGESEATAPASDTVIPVPAEPGPTPEPASPPSSEELPAPPPTPVPRA